jgi:hypothetical protein
MVAVVEDITESVMRYAQAIIASVALFSHVWRQLRPRANQQVTSCSVPL